jgi:hypothetical protein
MTVGSTVGEIASGQYNLTIEHEIDRSISFVEWGPKYVYFANEATEGTTWSRLSRSHSPHGSGFALQGPAHRVRTSTDGNRERATDRAVEVEVRQNPL